MEVLISGITEVLVFFRVMNFLSATVCLGPLQLAVKRMLFDVLKLLVLLVIIVTGMIPNLIQRTVKKI